MGGGETTSLSWARIGFAMLVEKVQSKGKEEARTAGKLWSVDHSSTTQQPILRTVGRMVFSYIAFLHES